MADWLTDATDAGVLVIDPTQYTSDGDAYTVEGVSRPPATGKPVLDSLNPAQYQIGSPSVTLHCLGSGFDRECIIAFAGVPERTDFHDDTDISTLIDSRYWTSPDTVEVRVVNPARGGSQLLDFAIVP
jgi:hypothetical protein